MPTVDSKVTEMDALTPLQDADIAMVIREITTGVFDNFKATLLTIKNYVRSESSVEITASGAAPVNKDIIILNVGSAGTVNLTLANGSENQILTVLAKQAASNVIITPANFTSTNITFTLTGQTLTLKFSGTKWYVIANYGTTIA
jgi:hypothetical protein